MKNSKWGHVIGLGSVIVLTLGTAFAAAVYNPHADTGNYYGSETSTPVTTTGHQITKPSCYQVCGIPPRKLADYATLSEYGSV